jgi:pyrroloquinoline quinone biosynthesis protein E
MLANPLALIAEITHRCPLHCVYCSNPLALTAPKSELSTEEWLRVFHEAARLGVLHLHLTGGEPAARADLSQLVAGAHQSGLYANLITSGLGVSRARLKELVDAGLDHIQLSFQDSTTERADAIAGTKSHAYKTELAGWIREHRIAFTANLVVHRQNLDHLEGMIAFLEELKPDRIEIAHTQYYGWALENRAALMPSPDQLERAGTIVFAADTRLRGKIRIDSVTADYYATYPKACMGGWGRRLMLIDPAGRALPCHAAGVIPGLVFDSTRERSLEWIWRESLAFQRFRGESWMPEPCRSCDRRGEDFGGCRCQAFLLTGDASATDPACSLAPGHSVIRQARNAATMGNAVPVPPSNPWRYRPNPKQEQP